MSGSITYNGHSLNDQQDWHVAEMIVRKTFDFSAGCQGVGYKYAHVNNLGRSRSDISTGIGAQIKKM
ncbi:hypothetical protein CsSME_00041315 [Camellia sinensis var. sinensis]